MPRWQHCLSAFFVVLFVQEALATATTDGVSSNTSSKLVLQLAARDTNVLDDNYFIPAVACIGAFVVLSLVCLYFLGCCCNSRAMDEHYSRAAVSEPRNSAADQRPTINLNALDGSDKHSYVSPTKTPPRMTPPPTQLSNQSSPALPSVRLQELNAQQWHNENQRPLMIPPTSHGFQPVPQNLDPPSVMSVRHLNPTAASYQNLQRSQIPRPYAQPEASRLSSMSSATSSTQIGSGVGDPAPYLYSPHQGNTLSYASSAAPSVVPPAWDTSNPRVPDNENLMPTAASSKQVLVQRTPTGPPAYMDDSRDHSTFMKKS